jgi:hypothetical protein
MAGCIDCLHFDICQFNEEEQAIINLKSSYRDISNDIANGCRFFKNKADVVEVETIKSWLYKMAINNVGCHIEGDFSNACEEIISRLDGLRAYASERRCEE